MDQVETHFRQLDIVKPSELSLPITVIGGGAIGSFSVLALAKMGCSNITVWDDDTVEAHNVGNQLSGPSDIDKPKTEVLAEIVKTLADIGIKQERRKYLGQVTDSKVLIVVTDNMSTRKVAYERARNESNFFIDGRMGAEFARIYSFEPFNNTLASRYEKTLYDDSEAEDLPCSGRSIIYCPFTIAGLICANVKKFVKGEKTPFEILFDIKQNLFSARN